MLTVKKYLRIIHRECTRPALIVAAVIVLLWLDGWLPAATERAELSALLTSSAFVLVLLGLTHLGRRVLAPRLDFQVFGLKALETPLSAAIAFFGLCYFLASVFTSNVSLLR
ncbi:MAG: hypothetical protein A2516_01620 [Alphaproteobacteria bacterium RIFOXYD12_FULL_60_8]|nr:MAG: hypothetical protein A2516_01620 [Alphaproteobacteria bacterium RIFOXYD12_FULL_60_8]